MRIAISGAGIAGPTLGYWLLRGGHEVVLIEQSPHFRTGGYVVDFWGSGYAVAERMGVLPEIRDRGYVFQELREVDGRGRTLASVRTDAFFRNLNGRIVSVPRGDLADVIYRTIEGRVETLFDNSMSGIEERSDAVLVSFQRGPSRQFDLVIGADGLHSGVRQIVFGSEHQFEKDLGYRVAGFGIPGYRPRDELVFMTHTTPGRQIGRFALREDRTIFLFLFASDKMQGSEPVNANERKAVLRHVFADTAWEGPQILAALDQVEDIYYDRVSQIKMPSWSMGRVMLIGDAAACVSLLAGEGAGLAMTEAYVLAGELNRAGSDYRSAFERHEQMLRRFVEKRQKSASYFAGALVPQTRWGLWFRNLVLRLMAVGPVGNYFLVRQLREDFVLPVYDFDKSQS
jgi:2-polyprenyl-6-methoxyphenol hydroxylase-like FAD-dependent oxidoreductase